MTGRAGMTDGGETPVLDAYEGAIRIVLRDLEPGGAVAVGPRGEATPADNGRVELAFLEEEDAGGHIQIRVFEEFGVLCFDV